MTSVIEDFSAAHVGVVGDVMLDRYWSGSARRISPEAPVPVVSVRETFERLGGAANVAANVAALGAQVILCGIVGDDPDADSIERLCAEQGIRSALVRTRQTSTTVKLRVLAQHQQLIRLDFESAAGALHDINLDSKLLDAMKTCRVLVFSDYAKGTLHSIPALITAAKAAGKTTIIDPKSADFAKYAGADVLTPNLGEFESVVGACLDLHEMVIRAQRLLCEHDFGAVLITRGEQGMSLVPRDGNPLHLPAQARDVFDVTGAGDTACAALACALASGRPLARAVEIANTAAGIAVGKVGTAIVTARELAAALAPSMQNTAHLLSHDEVAHEVAAARRRGERVVMTNGCFDVLHAGHVRYLEAAAALGDRLLVALNSDASVTRLKGAGRPLNPAAARAEVLARLRAVDWVTAFETDSPQELIADILPDVLVKGGDYQVEHIAGAKEVIAAGGTVTTVPFHLGFSSTKLITAAQSLSPERT